MSSSDSEEDELLNPKLLEQWKRLKGIKIPRDPQGSDIWEDDDLKTIGRLRFTRWDELDRKTRAVILRLVNATFCSGVSARGIAAVFQCAWGLRSAINPSALCFKEDIYLNPSKHITFDKLGSSTLHTAGISTTIERPRALLARVAKKIGVGGPGDITRIHHIAHMKGDEAERIELLASRFCQLAIGTDGNYKIEEHRFPMQPGRFIFVVQWSAEETPVIGDCFSYSCCHFPTDDGYTLLPAKENFNLQGPNRSNHQFITKAMRNDVGSITTDSIGSRARIFGYDIVIIQYMGTVFIIVYLSLIRLYQISRCSLFFLHL
ncbi:hypothetical protein V6N13_136339 [Hibiscus sabdariffa]